MKTRSLFKQLAALCVCLVILSMTACHQLDNDKDTTIIPPIDTIGIGYASDVSRLMTGSTDIQSVADVAAGNPSGTDFSPCATITDQTNVNPHVLTINFGNANCTCTDGRNRRGQIIVSYTGNYTDAGDVHTFTFNNYYVNDSQVTGTKIAVNMGTKENGQPYYSVIDTLMIGTETWISQLTDTFSTGYGTTVREDDLYKITGYASFYYNNNYINNITTTSPFQVMPLCHWIEAGTAAITPAYVDMRTVNYGGGGCDSNAVLVLDGIGTYDISLYY